MSTGTGQLAGFRLSPQQRHLWVLQQQNPKAFCTVAVVAIEGLLDVDLLRQALTRVIARNEILRTSFKTHPGVAFPTQVIGEPALSLNVRLDLRGVSREEEHAAASSLLDASAYTESFAALQTDLFELSSTRHLLRLTSLALCMDGAGMQRLVRELGNEYEGNGQPQAPVQYADLSEWLNRLLEKREAEADSHWGQRNYSDLFGAKLPLEFETARRSGFEPLRHEWSIPGETFRQAETIAARHGATVSQLLMAVWQVLLWRLNGKDEFLVGMLSEGRGYEEIENALGLLSAYLPARARFAEAMTIQRLLKQVQQEEEKACDLHEYWDWREVEKYSENGQPVFFPYCFSFEDVARGQDGAVSFTITNLYSCTDRFKLKLSFLRTHEDVRAAFHYDANNFSPEAISILAARYSTLLEDCLARPQAPLRELNLLSEPERVLLRDFSRTPGERFDVDCFHRLFEAQAARSPHRIAVVYEDARLTYDQLNRWANQLARRLRQQGVTFDSCVAIYMERSIEFVVALLAVSKASAAYMPFEVSPQHARTRRMMEDTRVAIVITDRRSSGSFAPDIREICLDHDAVAGENDGDLPDQPWPENLAYILFTSGSTGRPKAVAVEHRQVLNYLSAVKQTLKLTDALNYATVSTFAADLGNTVVLPSLCFGGTLHIIAPERILEADAFGEYCNRNAIDVLKIVPSHLKALLASDNADKSLPREVLVLGGETCHWSMVEKIRELRPGTRIFNHYGPTETTIGASVLPVDDRADRALSRTVPIGKPLGNIEIHILDRDLQSAPVMSPGELYIGGLNVCRGYLNQPDLTAERFIPNPFSSVPGGRLYRTGDIAKFLIDGNIEFIGRADYQVKIRGFRVELGEIESVLGEHPSVSQAVAVVREDRLGEKIITSYIVPKQKPFPARTELRNFCGERLPAYMVPSDFNFLDRLPLLPNGKLDRRKLLTIRSLPDGNEASGILPQNETERRIAAVWQEALQLESVDVDRHFFDIGGHSLLMVWVHSRLKDMFAKKISIVELFEYPTIRSLSEFLDRDREAPRKLDVSERVAKQKLAMSRRKQVLGSKHEERTST